MPDGKGSPGMHVMVAAIVHIIGELDHSPLSAPECLNWGWTLCKLLEELTQMGQQGIGTYFGSGWNCLELSSYLMIISARHLPHPFTFAHLRSPSATWPRPRRPPPSMGHVTFALGAPRVVLT